MSNRQPYDEDFYAWTQEQAQFLRSGEFSQLDIANIAEEMEDMGGAFVASCATGWRS